MVVAMASRVYALTRVLVAAAAALVPSQIPSSMLCPTANWRLRTLTYAPLHCSAALSWQRTSAVRMGEGETARRKARRAARRKKAESKQAALEAEPLPLASSLTELQLDLPVQNLESASVGESLPTFDDFRRRDEARQASAVNPVAPRDTEVKAPQDRLLELLTFDKIDERPLNEEPYDWTARLIGRGLPNAAGAYILPYLQSGHLLLVLVLLLSTFISYPGFPLTEVPDEYRELLRQGFLTTYVINTVAAVYSIGISAAKQQPVWFWCLKVWLLGGLALGELSEAVPDPPPEENQGDERRQAAASGNVRGLLPPAVFANAFALAHSSSL
eukprot:CAMPEP_0119355666 /NCGR_PEP_ID=MMETSP1334-20130426/4473_1 /TAXON_ID=127549 /ORGANISM="Calcidiscus leptoporus, Strain RCC1130" /LENGTH=329 /DNA_ID=CAMNT_0007369553 /DNA_START=12 /DNA_END=1002 /DNA_ORIENTATION=+